MLLVVVHPRSIAPRMKLHHLRVTGEASNSGKCSANVVPNWRWAGVSGRWLKWAHGLQALLGSTVRHSARETVDAAAGE